MKWKLCTCSSPANVVEGGVPGLDVAGLHQRGPQKLKHPLVSEVVADKLENGSIWDVVERSKNNYNGDLLFHVGEGGFESVPSYGSLNMDKNIIIK